MTDAAAALKATEFPFQSFRRALRHWYRDHGRHLPWRAAEDPYRVWISEIMLQQTTVTAVVPYFERFLKRFPDLTTLAAADESEVLRLWEGLGYYSRARNIHKTARVLVAQHEAQFPRDLAALQMLPGIGRYTAGAIASFAFGLRAPILEANTLRLYARLIGYRDDPRTTIGQRRLWEFAEQVLPARDIGPFNQALMDLGATVCTPERPACETCPVRTCCVAYSLNLQDEIPQRARRPEITLVTEYAVAVSCGQQYLLRKRQHGERWAGLWDFVRFSPPESHEDSTDESWMSTEAARRTGLALKSLNPLLTFKHSVTRYQITLRCFHATVVKAKRVSTDSEVWVSPEQFGDLPLSNPARKIARHLQQMKATPVRVAESLRDSIPVTE